MANPAPVLTAPRFARGERLTADKLNVLSDAVNALARRIGESETNRRRIVPHTPDFAMSAYQDANAAWRLAVYPGTLYGIDSTDIDRNLSIRALSGFQFVGTGNSAFNIAKQDWPNPMDGIDYQVNLGGTEIPTGNGSYLCVEWDVLFGSCDFDSSYMGGNSKFLMLEIPTNIKLKLVAIDDWDIDDNVSNSEAAVRRFGPIGFCSIANNTPNVVNWHSGSITMPLIYRDSANFIVSSDNNNSITAGTDGGAFYDAP